MGCGSPKLLPRDAACAHVHSDILKQISLMAMSVSSIFCPVCLERDPEKIPPRYPRCKGYHANLDNPHGAFRLDGPLQRSRGSDLDEMESKSSHSQESRCLIPSHEFVELPLLSIDPYNHDTSLLTFELPGSPNEPLGLPVCTHLLIRVPGKVGRLKYIWAFSVLSLY
jgi:hypothetical protein